MPAPCTIEDILEAFEFVSADTHLRRELGAALGLAESVGEPLIKANGLNGATDLRSVPSPDRSWNLFLLTVTIEDTRVL